MNNFDKFMNLYPTNDEFVNSSKEYFILLKEIALEINDLYNNQYIVKSSCGQTRLADVPWICIFNPDITSKAEKGIYACILFKSNMKGFYLGLGQGQQFFKDSYGIEGLNYLEKMSDYFRRQLNINSFNLNTIDLNVSRGSRGEGFEKANIVSKYYEKENFDMIEFKNDLDDILTIYDEIADSMSSTSYDKIVNMVVNDSNMPLDFINETNQKIEQDILKESGLDFGEVRTITEISIPKKKKKLTSVSTKTIRKVDGIEKTKHDTEIGLIGEELVIEYEKNKMRENGREDLVDKVIWESRINDQLGYDIRSYNFDKNGKEYEIFIEVKTTESNIKNTFFISKNEYEKMELYKDKYWIYRVSSRRHIFYKINYDEFQEKFKKDVYNYIVDIKFFDNN